MTLAGLVPANEMDWTLRMRFLLQNNLEWTGLARIAGHFNLAVGGTPEAVARTDPSGKGGAGPGNRAKLGSVNQSQICLGLSNKLKCSFSSRAPVPASSFAEAGARCVPGGVPPRRRIVGRAQGVGFPGSATVYRQNCHQGRAVAAGRAVCASRTCNLSICWSLTANWACSSSTRALWSSSGINVARAPLSPATSTIQRPSCLCASMRPALIRLRTVSADIPRCVAAARIDNCMSSTVRHQPMRFAYSAGAKLARFGQRAAVDGHQRQPQAVAP